MNWTSVIVSVSWRTMDPGVCNCDGKNTEIKRSDIKEGQYLSYSDPSEIMPSIKVLAMSDKGMTIEVRGRKYELVPDYWMNLERSGRDYTNFDLDIFLEPLFGPCGLAIDSSESILCIARNRYEIFSLSEEQVEALKKSDEPDEQYLLGRWYWLTAPEPDYVSKAESLFRKSMEGGCADAKMALARLYRYGDLGLVNLEEYERLRDEARKEGSLCADTQYYHDMAKGVCCEANPKQAIALLRERIKTIKDPDPKWFDVLGWALYADGQETEAGNAFMTSALKGYSQAYDGCLCVTSTHDVIVRARRAGCGFAYIFDMSNFMEEYGDAEEKRKRYLHGKIKSLAEKALLLGETSGAYFLSTFYFKGDYGFPKDDQKAWSYAQRGTELGDNLCYGQLITMTEDGCAPREVGKEELSFFMLQALRLGSDEYLNDVVNAFDEGCLQAYAEEIEKYYIPKYDEDLDYEDDDGRWDAYV